MNSRWSVVALAVCAMAFLPASECKKEIVEKPAAPIDFGDCRTDLSARPGEARLGLGGARRQGLPVQSLPGEDVVARIDLTEGAEAQLLDVAIDHLPVVIEERIVRVAQAIEDAPSLLEGETQPGAKDARAPIVLDAAVDAVAVHEGDLGGLGLPAKRFVGIGDLRVHLPEEVVHPLVEPAEVEGLDVIGSREDV
jgi:hypothetical protein